MMIVDVAGWTLLHFLWQGALLAVVLAGVLRAFPNRGPRFRYRCAYTVLVAMLIMPIATMLALGIDAEFHSDRLAMAIGAGLPLRVGHIDPGSASPAAIRLLTTVLGAEANLVHVFFIGAARMPLVAGLWFAGILIVGASWVFSVLRIRRVASSARDWPQWQALARNLEAKLNIRHRVGLAVSSRPVMPMLVGWRRPTIVLPQAALRELTASAAESLLYHELVHARRRDHWSNLIQIVVETLLFFHPAVWWVSHRMRTEREYCCDDEVVALLGSRAPYAQALVWLEENRRPGPRSAVLADSGLTLQRLRRLASGDGSPASPWQKRLAALTAIVALLAIPMILWAVRPANVSALGFRPQAEQEGVLVGPPEGPDDCTNGTCADVQLQIRPKSYKLPGGDRAV